MEKNTNRATSIWGKWWEAIRKWFYPAWLVYEVSIRFYEYGLSTHAYILEQQEYIGEIGAQSLAIFSAVATFVICTLYLTVPACLALYKFFTPFNSNTTRFEEKMKYIF